MKSEKEIWTIGHSTHTLDQFIAMLRSFDIRVLADIRSYPGSKRYPHFNKEALEISLPDKGIKYVHIKALGGRRKAAINSVNTAWRNEAFRGYADYMASDSFKEGIAFLQELALGERTAYCCSEAVWWRCHRSLVSDYLKWKGWKVMHISAIAKEQEHPYTAPAKIIDGKLSYRDNELFS